MLADRLRKTKTYDLTLIGAVGSIVGNMDVGGYYSSGGNSAAFDGDVNTTAWRSGFIGNATVGKIWTQPKYLARAVMTSDYIGYRYWAGCTQSSTHAILVQGSNNTTNGIDGTWTTLWTSPTFENHDAAYASIIADISDPDTDPEVYYNAHRFYIYTVYYDGISSGCLDHCISELNFYEWI